MATTALRHNFCTVAPMGHNFSLFFTIFKTHFFIFFIFSKNARSAILRSFVEFFNFFKYFFLLFYIF